MPICRQAVFLLIVASALIVTRSASASSPPPTVVGAVPGTKIALTAEARRAGVADLHRLNVVSPSGSRAPLLVGVGRKRELCVGGGRFFRCYAPDDARPAYAVAVFRGRRDDPVSGSVTGLVSTVVRRVAITFQDGTEESLPLRRWKGFPWAAFASVPRGPSPRLPSSLRLIGAAGGQSPEVNLGWFYLPSSCSNGKRPCPSRWTSAGDAFEPFPSRMTAHAKTIALSHPTVRRLLRSADYTVDPMSWSSPCDGRVFGAIVALELFRPIAVDADFPFTDFRDGTTRYYEGTLHIRASNVRTIHVAVDVLENRVVGIDPMAGDNVRVARAAEVSPFRAGPHDRC